MENKEHKLQVPFWEVVVHDKYDDEAWVWRYRNKPEPIDWVLDYFSEHPHPIFELDEEDGEYYNRQGDKLSDMIEYRVNGWDINIWNNGQDVYGVKAYCLEITRLQWKD
tara:strand:+ start:1104 stop:1430 length:327 start_codon:yes stop_codon:yes gene_type:complete